MHSSASPTQLYYFTGASSLLSRSPSSASASSSSPMSSRPSSSSGPRRSSTNSKSSRRSIEVRSESPSQGSTSATEQSCKSTCQCTKCTLGDFVFESEADYLDYLEIVSQLGSLPSSVTEHSKLHHHAADLTPSPATSPALSSELPSPSTSSMSSASSSPKLPSLTPLPPSSTLLLPSHLDRLPKSLNAQRAEQSKR